MTTNIDSRRQLPPEGEYLPVILLSWPHGNSDWADKLDEVSAFYQEFTRLLLSENIKVLVVTPDVENVKTQLGDDSYSPLIRFFECETNDTWTRDFGFITLKTDKGWVACDFKFNGWGLKFPSCFDNLVTSRLYSAGLIKSSYENHLNFVLEGGSIESDGEGTILTTSNCLLSPNRNGGFDKTQIETYLKSSLGAKRILWIENGALEGDDTDSHIDTLARLGVKNRILFTGCDNPSDSHYPALSKMKEELSRLTTLSGQKYQLIELPLPDPIFDDEGNRLPATYANYLVTPRCVFLPVYGQPEKDALAKQLVEKAYERAVLTIDCKILTTQHGSLHCATMQLPEEIIEWKNE